MSRRYELKFERWRKDIKCALKEQYEIMLFHPNLTCVMDVHYAIDDCKFIYRYNMIDSHVLEIWFRKLGITLANVWEAWL
ncbi:MAG: hypothetical protein LBC12_00525 [Nitrososphaerota archaeon]|jgi:hypothetical protein|nr:hypothetical protein [Nitrososphaerota archaeon]